MASTTSRIIYVGDPMCSWCWGIAPELDKLQQYCVSNQMGFEIKLGGLRTGGEAPWDQKMKEFLRHHWEQVHQVTGQPFSFDLLDLEIFDYNTEPACRLVVAARKWLGNGHLAWFAALQKLFYVKNKDLSIIQNLEALCEQYKIDFELFKTHFQSEEAMAATAQDFQQTRAWGVRGYPSLILKDEDRLIGLIHGYSTFENIRDRLQEYLSRSSSV